MPARLRKTPSPEVTESFCRVPLTTLRHLRSSPHPPVSVYAVRAPTIAAFLDRKGPRFATSFRSASRLSSYAGRIFNLRLPRLAPGFIPGLLPSRVPSSSDNKGCRNLLLAGSTDTHLCLSLGLDLPRADQLYSGNLDIWPQGFSPCSRYSFCILSFLAVHSSGNASLPKNTSYQLCRFRPCGVSAPTFFGADLRPVSCYVPFNEWSFLSSTSWGCLRDPNILFHLTPTLGP